MTPDEKKLFERTIRAKAKIEEALAQLGSVQHSLSCPTEDPESYAPCNCGAGKEPIRSLLQAALRELK